MKLSEARYGYRASPAERILDGREQCIDGALGVALGQIGAICHLIDQLGLGHLVLLVRESETVRFDANTADGRAHP